MAVDNEGEAWIQEIDAALQKWCQGDYVLGEQWFIQRFNPKRPLTDESKYLAQEEVDLAESSVRGFVVVTQTCDAQEEVDLAESSVRGFVVVTQTCDIVRSSASRPFIEVVPFVEVDKKDLHDIGRGRRPQYAYIPGAAEHRLVADLDRVMTVEKAVVAEWERKAGCSDEQDIRALGQALARKRVRFAFPDEFTALARKLQERLQNKHDKASHEGEALRALREIRVRAAPSWHDNEIDLMFWFIRHEEQVQFQGTGWDQQLQNWLALLLKSGHFKSIEGLVVTLDDMTAKEYVESDPLDIDHLSR